MCNENGKTCWRPRSCGRKTSDNNGDDMSKKGSGNFEESFEKMYKIFNQVNDMESASMRQYNHNNLTSINKPSIGGDIMETGNGVCEHDEVYEFYIKNILPAHGNRDQAQVLSKRLMADIKTNSSIEEMFAAQMVAAHAQAMDLTKQANTNAGPFSIYNSRANAEAMSFMRVFCQLASNYLKFRRQKQEPGDDNNDQNLQAMEIVS